MQESGAYGIPNGSCTFHGTRPGGTPQVAGALFLRCYDRRAAAVEVCEPRQGREAAALSIPSRRRGLSPGRIAQRESARFTRGRSLVRSQVRPYEERPFGGTIYAEERPAPVRRRGGDEAPADARPPSNAAITGPRGWLATEDRRAAYHAALAAAGIGGQHPRPSSGGASERDPAHRDRNAARRARVDRASAKVGGRLTPGSPVPCCFRTR